ncbi:MAG: PAS domain S-box protein, partial [Methanoregula sp.]|nr:PAS domain S-box protein [Methanoregula sp.]
LLLAAELLAGSLPLKILFHNLRYLFLPFIAVIELWLVIAFVKRTEWLRKDWAIAVLVIPVAAAILGVTSPLHILFRYNFSINSSGPVTVLQFTESPFFSLYILYSLVVLILAMAILIVESRRRGTLWEEQTILLLVALGFPTVINYLFVFGVTPLPGVNMTAPLLWIAAILYTVALFRYRFLDIIPIARSRLIETMGTPMLVLDTGGRIIDLNPAACTLFSITSLAAIGKPVEEIAPDWPAFLSLCRSKGTSRSELTREKDGGARAYTGSVELIRTSSGEPEGRLILLQDVTEQRQVEEALRQSEEKYREFFTTSRDCVFITSISGEWIDFNDTAMEMFGYDNRQEFGQRPVQDLYDRVEERTRFTALIAKEGYVREYPVRLKRKDGTGIDTLITAVPLRNPDGSPKAFVGSIRDITDRKRAEEQREILIRELSQKNTELDRFTYTVSHDLKSPLITIRGFLGLLEDDIKTADPVQVQKDIDRISSAAEKMERLITTLLELSRSGRTVDAPVRIPFTELAREAAGLLATSLTQHRVMLVIPDNLPALSGDRQRLLQVMTNLLDNATKFMGDQKEPRIEVGVRDDTGTPVFFVRDNGLGIKIEHLPKVFGLFERFNPDVPGTGIGLTTVKRIIEAHGGRIRAESEGEGKGTTMCFTLPGVAERTEHKG